MAPSIEKIISYQHTPVQDLGWKLLELIQTSSGDVNGPAVAVNLDIAVFDGVTGKLIKDGAMTIAQVIAAAIAAAGDVTGPAGAVNVDVAVFDGTTGKLIKDGGMTIAQIIAAASGGTVVGPGLSVNNDLVVWDGTTGALVKDPGVLYTSLVLGPASAVNLDIAVFDSTSGKLIKDGAQTIAQVIAAAIAGSGNVTGPGSSTAGDVASFNGTTGKIIQDSGKAAADLVTGPASAVNLDIAVFDGTSGKLIKDGAQTIAQVIAAAIAGAPQGDVVGPGSATNGNLAVFDGTTGKLIKDGGAPGGGGLVQYSQAVRTAGDITVASSSFGDLTGMSVTLTTGAHRCIITVNCVASSGAASQIRLQLVIDGAAQGQTSGITSTGANVVSNLSFTFVTGVLTAASHTIKLQALSLSAISGTVYASAAQFPLILGVTETNLAT